MARSTKTNERNDEWKVPPSKNADQPPAEPSPRNRPYNWRNEGHGSRR